MIKLNLLAQEESVSYFAYCAIVCACVSLGNLFSSASSLFDMGCSVIMALPCVDPEGGPGSRPPLN